MLRTVCVAAGIGVLWLGFGLAGCGSRPADASGEVVTGSQPARALASGPFRVEPLTTPAEPIRADAASVEVVHRVELLSWESDGPRPQRRLLIERDERDPGAASWTVTRTALQRVGGGNDEASPLRSDTYVLTPEGHVAIAEEFNRDESVEVVFEPAMVVMPRDLAPGTPFTQDFDVKVYPGGKGRTMLKSSGPGSHTIELTGLWRVTLAGDGQVEARGVRSVFRADFSPAKVVNTTEQWFVDGVGVIAERRHERTTVFGVPIRESFETWVAREISTAAPGDVLKP
jgi:hypothetical protein